MNEPLFVAALLLVALLASPLRAGDEAFFPRGLWYEGGVGAVRDNVLPEDPAAAAKVYDQNFADIAAHGINVIVVPNSPPSHHQAVLDAAQKHGLKVILELDLDGGELGAIIRGQQPFDEEVIRRALDEKLKPMMDHPALWRVQLLDEPPEGSFGRYGQVADIVREYAPRTPPFCCLVGNVNGDEFLKQTRSDVVAFDFYPLRKSKPGDDKPLRAFAERANRFAEWAQHHDARSWAVVQCHEITGALRFPTPAELRCMTYASLAAGSKGVYWFLYQTEHVGRGLMSGLVDRDFKPRPLWAEVATLSKEIEALSPVLSTLKRSKGGAFLEDAKGRIYVLPVNFDTLNAQTVTATAPARGAGRLVRLPDEQRVEFKRDGDNITWSVPLDPGAGALFRLDPAGE